MERSKDSLIYDKGTKNSVSTLQHASKQPLDEKYISILNSPSLIKVPTSNLDEQTLAQINQAVKIFAKQTPKFFNASTVSIYDYFKKHKEPLLSLVTQLSKLLPLEKSPLITALDKNTPLGAIIGHQQSMIFKTSHSNSWKTLAELFTKKVAGFKDADAIARLASLVPISIQVELNRVNNSRIRCAGLSIADLESISNTLSKVSQTPGSDNSTITENFEKLVACVFGNSPIRKDLKIDFTSKDVVEALQSLGDDKIQEIFRYYKNNKRKSTSEFFIAQWPFYLKLINLVAYSCKDVRLIHEAFMPQSLPYNILSTARRSHGVAEGHSRLLLDIIEKTRDKDSHEKIKSELGKNKVFIKKVCTMPLSMTAKFKFTQFMANTDILTDIFKNIGLVPLGFKLNATKGKKYFQIAELFFQLMNVGDHSNYMKRAPTLNEYIKIPGAIDAITMGVGKNLLSNFILEFDKCGDGNGQLSASILLQALDSTTGLGKLVLSHFMPNLIRLPVDTYQKTTASWKRIANHYMEKYPKLASSQLTDDMWQRCMRAGIYPISSKAFFTQFFELPKTSDTFWNKVEGSQQERATIAFIKLQLQSCGLNDSNLSDKDHLNCKNVFLGLQTAVKKTEEDNSIPHPYKTFSTREEFAEMQAEMQADLTKKQMKRDNVILHFLDNKKPVITFVKNIAVALNDPTIIIEALRERTHLGIIINHHTNRLTGLTKQRTNSWKDLACYLLNQYSQTPQVTSALRDPEIGKDLQMLHSVLSTTSDDTHHDDDIELHRISL